MLDVELVGQSVRYEAFKPGCSEYIGTTRPVMGINGKQSLALVGLFLCLLVFFPRRRSEMRHHRDNALAKICVLVAASKAQLIGTRPLRCANQRQTMRTRFGAIH